MRQCPLCLALFTDSVSRCPDDGSPMLPSDPLLGAIIADKYQLNAFIGAGAMGQVYRATQIPLDRTVAVKLIRKDLIEDTLAIRRFKREALAVARLRHPNIVSIYDFGTAPEHGAFLVLEYLEGQSLERELQLCDALPFAEAIAIIRQVCVAVHASHQAGVLHRDLKPHNLFIERRDGGLAVKILDFGIAKLSSNTARDDASGTTSESSESTSHGNLTLQGFAVGTPLYMSPEQGIGDPVDARTDVYSIGCVLYELLTGRPPFRGENAKVTLLKKVRGVFVSPRDADPSLPPEIDRILARALAPQVEERYDSAASFETALAALVAPPPASGIPDGTEPRAGANLPAGPGTNLPQPVTNLIGRAEQIPALLTQLATTRCLTLTGPGGVGKTRLALELARGTIDAWPDGIWFVDLSRLTMPDAVVAGVAGVLGLREEHGRPLFDTVQTLMKRQRVLLVFDNCEHVLADCAAFATAILDKCPGVKILATSREPLRITAETVWRVPALAVDPEPSSRAAAAGESDAVRLFADRAHFVSPSFALTAANTPAVAEICRRLEGLPLAIELAAACVKLLSVDQLLEKLNDRFRVLVSGTRTANRRHRTLRATIDWSFNLLTPDEQCLFIRLSVFSRGFSAEAAQIVCAGDPIDALAVLDLIDRLADKSLVLEEPSTPGTRYRLLDTIWEYARERLNASGDAGALQRAHRDWYLELAESARDELSGPKQGIWIARLETEIDNLRAALDWSINTAAEAAESLRITSSLYRFWDIHGYQIEGRQWIERALAIPAGVEPELRANALFGTAILSFSLGDYAMTRARIEDCIAIHRARNHREDIARALNLYSLVAGYQGDFALATELQEESLAVSRELGLTPSINQGMFHLGLLAMQQGHLDQAKVHLGASVEGWNAAGNRLAAAGATLNLAEIARLQDDLLLSSHLLDECMRVAAEMDAKTLLAACQTHRGQVLSLRGRHSSAFQALKQARDLCRETGSTEGSIVVVENCAIASVLRGEPEQALTLIAAATAAREAANAPLDPARRAELDQCMEDARASLPPADAHAAFASGKSLSIDHALDLAFENR